LSTNGTENHYECGVVICSEELRKSNDGITSILWRGTPLKLTCLGNVKRAGTEKKRLEGVLATPTGRKLG